MDTEEFRLRSNARTYRDSFAAQDPVRAYLSASNRNRGLNNKQLLLKEYYDHIIELDLTYIRLKRFPLFLSSHNPAWEHQGVSRVSQFIYHVENYLAGVYILDQRIMSFSRSFGRRIERQRCSRPDIRSFLTAARDLRNSVQPLVSLRGAHTHSKMFEDKEITDMEALDKAGDFVNTVREARYFKSEAKSRLSIQRKKWKKDIKSDLKKFELQLGCIYEIADKLLWEAHRNIR